MLSVMSEGLTAAHINLQMPTPSRALLSLVLQWGAEAQAMAGGTASAPFISLCRAKEPLLTLEMKGFVALSYGQIPWSQDAEHKLKTFKSFCTAKPHLTKQRPRKQALPQLRATGLSKKRLQSGEYKPPKSDVHSNRNSCCCEGSAKGRYNFKAAGSLSHSTSLQSLTRSGL